MQAIRNYEAFARGLQDAFNVLRAEAATPDARGFVVPHVARNEAFKASVNRLDERFAAAHRALGEVTATAFSLPNLFDERFGRLAEPMDAPTCAIVLCEHHEAIQKAKSAAGTRCTPVRSQMSGHSSPRCSSYVETEAGRIYRRGAGQTETKEPQPPIRIPRRLLAHLRRWGRNSARFVVDGRRVGSVKTASRSAVKEAGMGHCIRHDLHHAAVTWAMQRGFDK